MASIPSCLCTGWLLSLPTLGWPSLDHWYFCFSLGQVTMVAGGWWAKDLKGQRQQKWRETISTEHRMFTGSEETGQNQAWGGHLIHNWAWPISISSSSIEEPGRPSAFSLAPWAGAKQSTEWNTGDQEPGAKKPGERWDVSLVPGTGRSSCTSPRGNPTRNPTEWDALLWLIDGGLLRQVLAGYFLGLNFSPTDYQAESMPGGIGTSSGYTPPEAAFWYQSPRSLAAKFGWVILILLGPPNVNLTTQE